MSFINKRVQTTYLLHFVAAVSSLIIFLWLISIYLDAYTLHGKYIDTPNLIHLPLKDAIQIIESKKLRYKIIDSIYQPKEKPGVVISQNPDTNTKVKENRTIYLTISSFQPPSIEMPKLVDLSERQAIMILSSYGLKLGKIIYEPSYCNGCVVKQLYNHQEILPGKYIKKGSIIDLVVGQKNNFTPTTSSAKHDTINSNDTSFE